MNYSLKEFLMIAGGGACGSAVRFYLGKLLQESLWANFPWGILLVNISGCFAIGLLMSALSSLFIVNPLWRLLLITGFLGWYTTFSGFTMDVINMLRQGLNAVAISYVAASVGLCLLATWSGFYLGQIFKLN